MSKDNVIARRLAPSVFSLARGTQLAGRRHWLIERRRGAQKGFWTSYPPLG